MRLTDEQWAVVQSLLPPPPSAAQRGRPPLDDRRILDGVLWKIAADIPWYDLPKRYPPYQTCYRRYIHWQRTGLFDQIITALLKDLAGRGHLDLQTAVRNGDLLFTRQGERWRLHLSPTFAFDWRALIALVFARSVAERLSPSPQPSSLADQLLETLARVDSPSPSS